MTGTALILLIEHLIVDNLELENIILPRGQTAPMASLTVWTTRSSWYRRTSMLWPPGETHMIGRLTGLGAYSQKKLKVPAME